MNPHSAHQKQASGFYRWLCGFPVESKNRLKKINSSATSSRHIILTLSFGLIDPNIRALNRMITHFMLLRMKCEKRGDCARVQRMESKLEELHLAIDTITGVYHDKKKSGELCKSVVRRSTGIESKKTAI